MLILYLAKRGNTTIDEIKKRSNLNDETVAKIMATYQIERLVTREIDFASSIKSGGKIKLYFNITDKGEKILEQSIPMLKQKFDCINNTIQTKNKTQFLKLMKKDENWIRLMVIMGLIKKKNGKGILDTFKKLQNQSLKNNKKKTKSTHHPDLSDTRLNQVQCGPCYGSGKITCSSCGGYGYHSTSRTETSWDGSPRYVQENIPCSSCSGGRQSCWKCGGSGIVFE